MSHRHRSGAGLHLGDDSRVHRGGDDVLTAAVVPAANAVEGIHADGAGLRTVGSSSASQATA